MLVWQVHLLTEPSPQLPTILPEPMNENKAHLKLCVLISWFILNFMVYASMSFGERKIKQNKLYLSMILFSFFSVFLSLHLQLGPRFVRALPVGHDLSPLLYHMLYLIFISQPHLVANQSHNIYICK